MKIYLNPILIGVVLIATSVEARQYQIERLGSLGAGYARARSISNSGQIVGEALIPVQGSVEHAFRWKDGQMIDLGTLGGTKSRAMDVNGQGYAVGWSYDSGGVTKPVYWDHANYINELQTLGGRYGTAWSINELGQAVGNAYLNNSVYHASLWSGDGITDLGTLGGTYSIAYDINADGVVVGAADNLSGEQKACLWDGDVKLDLGALSGGSWNTARGLNDSGQVILWGTPTGATKNHAAIWNGRESDSVIDLGTFGGAESWAYGVNNLGNVVGWAEDASGYYRAFIYDGTRMTDLGTLGGMFSSAYGVSDSGIIAGYAQNASGQWESVRWVPVPEPSSAMVLVLPFAFLLVSWRRRSTR